MEIKSVFWCQKWKLQFWKALILSHYPFNKPQCMANLYCWPCWHMFKMSMEAVALNHLSKMSFFHSKIKQDKGLESQPAGVFTHYAAFSPDCLLHRHLQMQRSPLGNQDCSREGGASGGVDMRCTGRKLRWEAEPSVSQSPSSESNLKSCRISLRASLFLMILEPGNTPGSTTLCSNSLTEEWNTWRVGGFTLLTPAWSLGSSPDSCPPPGGPGPAAWPAAAWPSVRGRRCEGSDSAWGGALWDKRSSKTVVAVGINSITLKDQSGLSLSLLSSRNQ